MVEIIGSQELAKININIKRCHEEWFYLIGPGMEEFSQWSLVDLKFDPPNLSPDEEEMYDELLKLDGKTKILSYNDLRNEEFLLKIEGIL